MKSRRRRWLRIRIDVDRRAAVAAGVVLSLFAAGWAVSETFTFTSSYPSPSGVYRKLVTTMDTVLGRDGGAVTVGSPAKPAAVTVNGTQVVTGNVTLARDGGAVTISGSLGVGGVQAGAVGAIGAASLAASGNIGGGSLSISGNGRFSGKATSASTADNDGGSTLATKDYVDRKMNGGGVSLYSITVNQRETKCCDGTDRMLTCFDTGQGQNHWVERSGNCCTPVEGPNNYGGASGSLLCIRN